MRHTLDGWRTPLGGMLYLIQLMLEDQTDMNIDKTEIICFNQDSAISSLNGKPLKLVDQFIYLGSNISSIQNNVYICIGKVWIAIDRLPNI